MLRNMEMPGANANAGKWLQVFGWGIEWEGEPTHASPIFHCDNIQDDFHWSLYSRFTSKQAEREFTSCALVEVENVKPSCYNWRSTGRVRLHANLPKFTHFLCRDERLAWLREHKPPSVDQLGNRALILIKELATAEWFHSAVPDICPELGELNDILAALPSAEERRSKRSKRRNVRNQ